MHNRMHETEDGNQNSGHFMHVNVIVQRQNGTEATRS